MAAPHRKALSITIGLAALCATPVLLGCDDRMGRSAEPPTVASPPSGATGELARWTALLELVNQQPSRPTRCLLPEEADRARRHDTPADRALRWLRGDARHQLRLAFGTLTAEHSKPARDALQDALIKYEIGLAIVVSELRGLSPPRRLPALQGSTAQPSPVMVRVEPTSYDENPADLLPLIERSERLVDDLSDRIPIQRALCELVQ
jgi:hypothetical protein